ncbi:MAG TPA: mannose-1-phosphate guanylyltransferase/mannose-6-phosphate isomerase [Gammaproteobacteria bacterium]|nr:mannose-1-phosphate guanylyltransferase/mannose-6-phosphate isomerase [Gammaproteobacteria bacterium]
MPPVLQPVILSGGSGTRLWPLSRSAFPKQFHALVDDLTLLQATATRCDGIDGCEIAAPMVVCNDAHRFLVADQLLERELPHRGILLEPEGRNTAPALTLAALHATAEGDDPLLVAMPADHVIRDQAAFREALAEGVAQAAEDQVVTFGIVPDSPHTGYGYIRQGESVGGRARRLAGFTEKPDRATAEAWLAEGDYLWNSGIFLLRAGRWLELMDRYRPDILEPVRRAYAEGKADLDFYRVEKTAFAASPSDSIDYAVMEPLARDGGGSVVVPLDAGWSDIGAWEALWSVSERDADGNAVRGDVLTEDAHDNLLFAQSRMLAAVGVDDLVVVETPDAVLVADKSRAQEVKKIAERLKAEERAEHQFHRCVHRPWGTFEGIDQGHRFQVKRLTVKPGASLSLQMHHHRAEHWIVVRGTARVTRGDETFLLTENQSTYIPLGTAHRLENPGRVTLEIIEVQSGSYLGEDDIVRFEDRYNREQEGDA